MAPLSSGSHLLYIADTTLPASYLPRFSPKSREDIRRNYADLEPVRVQDTRNEFQSKYFIYAAEG